MSGEDILKTMWGKASNKQIVPSMGVEELDRELNARRNANNVIDKLRMGFRIDFQMGLAFTLLLIAFLCFAHYDAYYGVTALVFLCVMIFFLTYYIVTYRRINLSPEFSKPLKEAIAEVIAVGKRFTRIYALISMVAGCVLLPPVIVLSFSYRQNPTSGEPHYFKLNLTGISSFEIIFYSLFLVVYLIAYCWFVKWYTNKLYGRHIKLLEEQVAVLNGENQ
jgi:hypothetical protein